MEDTNEKEQEQTDKKIFAFLGPLAVFKLIEAIENMPDKYKRVIVSAIMALNNDKQTWTENRTRSIVVTGQHIAGFLHFLVAARPALRTFIDERADKPITPEEYTELVNEYNLFAKKYTCL